MQIASFLLAESANITDISNLTPLIQSISSVGFCVWYAWYTITVVIPTMQKEHREERATIRAELLKMLDDMIGEMKASREAFDRWKTEHKG